MDHGRLFSTGDVRRAATCCRRSWNDASRFPTSCEQRSAQTAGLWRESDFLPLPCAHPNTHTLAYAYRHEGRAVPLTRFIDVEQNLDLLANGITFNRASARDLIAEFLSRNCCGTGGDCGCGPVQLPPMASPKAGVACLLDIGEQLATRSLHSEAGRFERRRCAAQSFFRRALTQDLSPADVFRITITSFMDPFNFDIRALMKSCVHHLLPSGHLIPFCAYNNLYRDGHVPLPPFGDVPLKRAASDARTASAS